MSGVEYNGSVAIVIQKKTDESPGKRSDDGVDFRGVGVGKGLVFASLDSRDQQRPGSGSYCSSDQESVPFAVESAWIEHLGDVRSCYLFLGSGLVPEGQALCVRFLKQAFDVFVSGFQNHLDVGTRGRASTFSHRPRITPASVCASIRSATRNNSEVAFGRTRN